MCGIFGYVGNKTNASDLILSGLKLLEYRGYDSWGISVKVGKKIEVDKHTGKIGDAKIKLPKSNLGIGHTRWATHGGVTTKNAHPHMDCTKTISVVHNGIVENYQELKTQLIKKGHKFISETDTEVIAHLIEVNLKNNGFATSVKNAFNNLQGLNAIVVLNAVSNEIVAAKNGSPLIVGIEKNGFIVASDLSPILQTTKKIVILKDYEMAIIGESLKLITLPAGKNIKPKIETVDWDIETSTRGKFGHFMLKEINDQSTVIKNITNNYTEQITQLANLIKRARGTFFIAAGRM